MKHCRGVGAFWSVGELLHARLFSFFLFICSILFSLFGRIGIQLLSLGLPSKNILPTFGLAWHFVKGKFGQRQEFSPIFVVANQIAGKGLVTLSDQ